MIKFSHFIRIEQAIVDAKKNKLDEEAKDLTLLSGVARQRVVFQGWTNTNIFGDCLTYIDFYVFLLCFHTICPKFPIFKRVQNSGIKFWIVRKHEIMKLNKIIVFVFNILFYFHLIL